MGIPEKAAEADRVEVKDLQERMPTCRMGQVNGGLNRASKWSGGKGLPVRGGVQVGWGVHQADSVPGDISDLRFSCTFF